jgi:hypothetical protein
VNNKPDFPEGGDNPKPVVQAGGGDAGDESPDMTANGNPNAVFYEQTANNGGGNQDELSTHRRGLLINDHEPQKSATVRQDWHAPTMVFGEGSNVDQSRDPLPITRHCGLNATVGSADTKSAYSPGCFCPEAIQFLGYRVRVVNALDAEDRARIVVGHRDGSVGIFH